MAPSQSAGPKARPVTHERRSNSTVAAFAVGLPLGAAILGVILFGPLRESPAHRYVSHPVECVEVVMFCCALGALGAKLARSLMERAACRTEILPPWDGKAMPVAEGSKLLATLGKLPRRLQNTYLVNRTAAVLNFLCSRGSAAELDDQLRSLTDNDSIALEGSYSLIRFITWAMPILGFLGTVLGITQSISGVTPEKLEKDLSQVTDGLALAFDTTALALGLTMITMFFTFIVDRAEQGVLESVDRFADRQLAHRFERAGAESGPFVEVVRHNTQVLLASTEGLVQRQVDLWTQAMEQADRRRAEADRQQQERLSTALEAALERTLQTHTQRLAALEKQAVDQSAAWLEQLAALAASVRETARAQQAALLEVAESVVGQAEVLGRLQEGEKQLIRLQEALNQNLTALSGAGSFEQAVQSLTAAVHLLTARASVLPTGGVSRLGPRPGAAA